MNVRSPGRASRMPATPWITNDPSPTKCPFSSVASSARVRVTMSRTSSSSGALLDLGVELTDDFCAQVETAIGVDDGAAGGVEYDVEPLLAGQLLDHATDAFHDLTCRTLVLLRRAS